MNYQGRKVVVTGADGFIGSHVVEQLVAAGADVTALALYTGMDSHGWLDDLAPTVRAAIRIVRGDVRDAAFTTRLLAQQEICFHLAALIAIPYSYVAPQSYVDVNVSGTLNVLEAARANGLSRVVHTSTSEVYGTAQTMPMDESHPLQGQSPYSASKIGADALAESYARSFDLPVVILRPFNTYGPRQSERAVIASTIRQIVDPACEVIKLGDLSPKRDFTFVQDTADAFLALGQAEGIKWGEVFNGGTGRTVTIAEMVETLCRISASAKPIVHDLARARPEKSEVLALLANNTKLVSSTSWRPKTGLEEGLAQTMEWWRPRLMAGLVRADANYLR